MKKTVFPLVGAVCVFVLADIVHGQPADPRRPVPQDLADSPRFQRLDADGDGKVSRAEFLGSIRDKKHWWQLGRRAPSTEQNSATPEMFTELDRNRDGYLTNQELNSRPLPQPTHKEEKEGTNRAQDARGEQPPKEP
jgi:Ca2+-binding EF-hand superfamily protein